MLGAHRAIGSGHGGGVVEPIGGAGGRGRGRRGVTGGQVGAAFGGRCRWHGVHARHRMHWYVLGHGRHRSLGSSGCRRRAMAHRRMVGRTVRIGCDGRHWHGHHVIRAGVRVALRPCRGAGRGLGLRLGLRLSLGGRLRRGGHRHARHAHAVHMVHLRHRRRGEQGKDRQRRPQCGILRAHRHDLHHAGVHVVEKVAVERPVADRVGGQVEGDGCRRGRRLTVCLRGAWSPWPRHQFEEMAVQMDRMRHHRVVDEANADALAGTEGDGRGDGVQLHPVERPHIAFPCCR